MRTDIDSDFIAALEAECATVVIGITLEFGENVYRWCNGSIPVYIGGYKFDPVPLNLDSIESEGGVSVMRAQLTLGIANDQISSVLLAEDPRRRPVNIYWVALDLYGRVAASGTAMAKFFQGLLDDYDINYGNETARLYCVNDLIYWQSKTLVKAEPTCPWVFKGDQCGYTGDEEWCRQTSERCEWLGNTDNYGGDLFLPEISERQLWWGKGVK